MTAGFKGNIQLGPACFAAGCFQGLNFCVRATECAVVTGGNDYAIAYDYASHQGVWFNAAQAVPGQLQSVVHEPDLSWSKGRLRHFSNLQFVGFRQAGAKVRLASAWFTGQIVRAGSTAHGGQFYGKGAKDA